MARVFARQFQGLSGLGLGGVKFIRGVVGMGLGGSIGTRGMCRSRKYYRIGIQGAPMKAGQKQNGVEHGPGIITGTGLVTTLEEGKKFHRRMNYKLTRLAYFYNFFVGFRFQLFFRFLFCCSFSQTVTTFMTTDSFH